MNADLNGELVVQPRDVDIHDLLCREPVLDGESVGRFLQGRVVLVTGAAGSIGSEICRQVLAFQPDALVLLDHSENGLFFIERELRDLARETEVVPCIASITDASRLRTVFDRYRPAVVFHAAAHKHVPMMEANPGEAVKNNVFGTRIAGRRGRPGRREAFVMISTDKAVNPTSVMGATKRAGRDVRPGALGRSRDPAVTRPVRQRAGLQRQRRPDLQGADRRGGPVTVTHPEMTRYFMTIPEAASSSSRPARWGAGARSSSSTWASRSNRRPRPRPDPASGLVRGEISRSSSPGSGRARSSTRNFTTHEMRLATPHPKIFPPGTAPAHSSK